MKSICTHTRVCQRLLQGTLSTIAHASLPKLCKSQHCAVWKNTRSQLSRFSLQTLIGMCFKHMECVSNFDKTMIRCVSNDGLTYHRCYNCLLWWSWCWWWRWGWRHSMMIRIDLKGCMTMMTMIFPTGRGKEGNRGCMYWKTIFSTRSLWLL